MFSHVRGVDNTLLRYYKHILYEISCNNLHGYFEHCPSSWLFFKKTQRFGDWICLRHQVKVEERDAYSGSVRQSYYSLHHWSSDSD
jgi:hypothetical protein